MPTEADRVFRDHVRYTGDGLPNAPVGRPLPGGDPASGVHNPRKDEVRDLINELEIPAAASTGTPHYQTQAAAAAATIPVFAQRIIVDQTVYRRVTDNPQHKKSFQDTAGNWWSGIDIPTTGPVEVWVAWGQSEMRGVSGVKGGGRSARDGVLLYTRGNSGRVTPPGVPDGFYASGPEDAGWPFYSSIEPTGSPFYLAAAKRAKEIGGLVVIIPYALGGEESGLFVQGGSMWVGLQASWTAALDTPLPGRGGATLRTMGKTLADVMMIWQGSADADYKLGTGDAAATADDWVTRWRTIFNSLESPSGMSEPIIRAGYTKIVMFEMLHGATNGGGDPTDSRNRDLHKFLKYTSSKRHQIAIVPMAGVNNSTANGDIIGSHDNLHPNGAAYNEIDRRLSSVLEAFDPTDRNSAMIENSDGYTICYPDGTFKSWSKDLVTPNNVAVAYDKGFRTSNVNWTIPFPAGYAAAEAPAVAPCQCTTAVASTFPGARVGQVTTATATAYAVSDATIAGVATLRLMAQGIWTKT